MTTHIVYSHFDAEHPATLSRAVLTGLLRECMGFQSIIISDAMAMHAIADNYDFDTAVVLAVEAGCDAIIAKESMQTFEALQKGFTDGTISEARVDASVSRMLAAKEELGPRFHSRSGPSRVGGPEAGAQGVGSPNCGGVDRPSIRSGRATAAAREGERQRRRRHRVELRRRDSAGRDVGTELSVEPPGAGASRAVRREDGGSYHPVGAAADRSRQLRHADLRRVRPSHRGQ